MSDKLKQLILEKRKEGKLCYMALDSVVSIDIAEFIKQPVDGILYDLNRLEETALTFLENPKWVNDFAVALTIRELYRQLASAQTDRDALARWYEARKLYYESTDLGTSQAFTQAEDTLFKSVEATRKEIEES